MHVLRRHVLHRVRTAHRVLRVLRHWRRWTSLLLALELIERLLRRQCHDRVLTVQLLFRQIIHDDSHRRLGSEGDHTEPFRLSICTILKKLHFLEIINADAADGVLDVLICRPLE